MKNYKIWLAVVALLLIINSAVLAVVWFRKGPPALARHERPLPQGEPKDLIIKTLAFTPKQKAMFTDMRTQHHELVNKLNDANRKLRDSLFDNIKKPKADTVLINAIAKKISDNQAGIEKATLYHFRQLRGILTANQQTKFDSIINDVLRMMARPGNGQGPPQGGRPGDNMPPPRDNGKMDGRRHGMKPEPGDMPPPPRRDKMDDGKDMPPPPDGPPDGMPPQPPGKGKPGDHKRLPPPPGDRPPPPPGERPHDGPPPM